MTGSPRAVRISRYGGPEVLQIVPIDIPRAGEGEVVVELAAAGVNPVDTKVREGTRGAVPLAEPVGLGSDGAGVVLEVGAGVEGLAPGDRVAGRGLKWAFATHVAAPAAKLTRLPDAVTFEQGAAIGIPAPTAYQVLRSLGVSAGETLLVHAGSGAVGQAAIQFARLWGATVIATGGRRSHERLRELGAIPVVYGDGLLERVRAAAPQGVDVVLEAAGTQEALDVSLALVADRRRIAEIVIPTAAADYGVTVFSGGLPGSVGPAENALRAEAVPLTLGLIAAGDFRVELGERFALDDAAGAMRLSESKHPGGKILLLP